MSQEERIAAMQEMAQFEAWKDEFSLPDFQFDYDEHWDLGHGWSEHDFEIYAK